MHVAALDKGPLPAADFKLAAIRMGDGARKVTDQDFARLRGMASLRRLILFYEDRNANITDAIFDHLQGLKNLEELGLHGTSAGHSNKVYQYLKDWPNLLVLSVQGRPTEADFMLLGAHGGITDFVHPDCRDIGEAVWLHLKFLKLRSLRFSGGRITEKVAEIVLVQPDLENRPCRVSG